MTILVTGASGLLGGALASALVRNGERVRALVRPTSRVKHLEKLKVELHAGSLEDKASIGRAVEGTAVIYHCAAASTDWAPWETYYSANVVGVHNLLEAASRQDSLRRFVHVSTTDVYGFPERACDETHPIVDIGLPYNRSKGLGEKLVWEFYEKRGLPVTVVRPVTLYGPRDKNYVIEVGNVLLRRQGLLINGGRSIAGLLYVDNAVEGLMKAACSPNTVGQAYNLRDGTNESWRDYFDALADGLKVPRPRLNLSQRSAMVVARIFEAVHALLHIWRRPLLTRHIVLILTRDQGYPIGRAQRDFGFSSGVSFSEGVSRSLAWLESDEGRAAVPH